jgi:hypothetical protein
MSGTVLNFNMDGRYEGSPATDSACKSPDMRFHARESLCEAGKKHDLSLRPLIPSNFD